jgi:hypothetical protein
MKFNTLLIGCRDIYLKHLFGFGGFNVGNSRWQKFEHQMFGHFFKSSFDVRFLDFVHSGSSGDKKP